MQSGAAVFYFSDDTCLEYDLFKDEKLSEFKPLNQCLNGNIPINSSKDLAGAVLHPFAVPRL